MLASIMVAVLCIAEGIVIYAGHSMRTSVTEAREAMYFAAIQDATVHLANSAWAKAELARGNGGSLALEDLTSDLIVTGAEIERSIEALREMEGGDEHSELVELESRLQRVRRAAAGIVVGAFTPDVLDGMVASLELELSGLNEVTGRLLREEQESILSVNTRLEGARKAVEKALPMVLLLGFGAVAALFGLSRRLAAADAEARRARERSHVLEAVTHQLRTPLSVILGLSSELADAPDSFTAKEIAEFSRVLRQQSWLVTDKVESAALTLRSASEVRVAHQEVDIGEEVRRSAAMLDRSVPVRGEGVVRADRERVRFILRSLIARAFQSRSREVFVDILEGDANVAVEVRDDGDRPTENAFAGSGGRGNNSGPASCGSDLTTCQRLAVLMGGDLSYRREEGLSVFTLILPRAIDTPGPAEVRQSTGVGLVAASRVHPLNGDDQASVASLS